MTNQLKLAAAAAAFFTPTCATVELFEAARREAPLWDVSATFLFPSWMTVELLSTPFSAIRSGVVRVTVSVCVAKPEAYEGPLKPTKLVIDPKLTELPPVREPIDA